MQNIPSIDVSIGMVSLFNGISSLIVYLMPKLSLQKNSNDTVQPIIGEIKRVYSFPNGISPKLDIIAQIELELAYFKAAVQYFNHNTMDTLF